jgi:hypothetical protein
VEITIRRIRKDLRHVPASIGQRHEFTRPTRPCPGTVPTRSLNGRSRNEKTSYEPFDPDDQVYLAIFATEDPLSAHVLIIQDFPRSQHQAFRKRLRQIRLLVGDPILMIVAT